MNCHKPPHIPVCEYAMVEGKEITRKIELKYLRFTSIVILMLSLFGCAATWTVPQSQSHFGQTTSIIKTQTDLPPKGYFLTRQIGDSVEPNRLWWRAEIDGDLFVLDMALELQEVGDEIFYRAHIYPIRAQNWIVDSWGEWIEIRINFDDNENDSAYLYAQLPKDRSTDASGRISTSWASCSACLQSKQAKIRRLVQTQTQELDWIWYDLYNEPKKMPDWQGDLAQVKSEIENRTQQQLAQEAARRQQLQALEASLPVDVRKDKYMVQLSTALKQSDYPTALEIFPKLEALPVETDPSLKYFYGEALLKTNQPELALSKLYEYVSEQGATATHYTKALDLINQAESRL